MGLPPEQLSKLIDQQWKPLLVWVGNCHGMEEDVLQDAFIRLATADPAPDNPKAWLYVAAQNLAKTARTSHRRRARRQEIVAQPERVTAESDSLVVASDLETALARLPADLRQIVVARVWGDLPFEQIAQSVGQSTATCWRRYQDALRLLRKTYGVPCPNLSK